MATFPSISPTYGVQKRSAPRVRAIQFGSGYQQRAQFGIQQNPKVYNPVSYTHQTLPTTTYV